MNIGLLGARGLLGSAIGNEIIHRGSTMFPIYRETNYADLPRFDLLINAAGNSKKFLGDTNPAKDFHDNVDHVVRILALNSNKNVPFVHISSSEVYGLMTEGEPLKHEDYELRPVSNYGFSKAVAEQVVKQYSDNWIILRLAGMFGEGMYKGPIFDILNGLPLRLTPNSTLQLMNTREVSQLILDIIEVSKKNEIYNIASHEILTIEEIGKLMNANLNYGSELSEYHSCLDISKFSKFFTIKSQAQQLLEFLNQ